MDSPDVNRRDALRALGGLGTAALAGCSGLFERQSSREPPVLDDRPNAVYLPTHVDGMEMIDMTGAGDRMVGLMYSYPHRFWTVTGTETNLAQVENDDVHLMVSVWDPDSETVLPVGTEPTIEITQGDTLVASRSPWPMLSQSMGYHFGDNFPLAGDGTYTVTVDVPALSEAARVGGFADRFDEAVTAEFEWEYSADARDELPFRELEDAGDQGAVEPMDMMMPLSVAPAAEDLPGRVVGSGASGDVEFVLAARDAAEAGLDDGDDGGDAGEYLAVSARTPYNRYVIPQMSVSAAVERDGEAVFDDALGAAVDPDLGYHYGAVVDGVESGDEVTVTVDSPPVVSRHEGYETAFFDVQPLSVTAE